MAIPTVTSRRAKAGPFLRLRTGTYVTDERNLYRCVSTAPPHDSGATALMEDCRTLDLVVVPLDEPSAEGLRVVEPKPDNA